MLIVACYLGNVSSHFDTIENVYVNNLAGCGL